MASKYFIAMEHIKKGDAVKVSTSGEVSKLKRIKAIIVYMDGRVDTQTIDDHGEPYKAQTIGVDHVTAHTFKEVARNTDHVILSETERRTDYTGDLRWAVRFPSL